MIKCLIGWVVHEMAPEAHLHAWKQRLRYWEAELEARESQLQKRETILQNDGTTLRDAVSFLETAEPAGDGEQLTVGPCS